MPSSAPRTLRRDGAYAQIRGLALVPILQNHIEHARVVERGVVVQRGNAGNADHAIHARRLFHQLDGFRHRRRGSLRRCGLGKIEADDEIALVFVRQKAGRHARQTIEGKANQPERRPMPSGDRAPPAGERGWRRQASAPRIDRIESAIDDVPLLGRRGCPEPQGALGRLQRQCVHRRNESGGRDDESELLIHFAGQPERASQPGERPP